MWSDDASRLALVELWASGSLRQRKRQAEAWADLAQLPWTRRTGRRDELSLAEDSRDKLEVLLDRCFPRWRDAVRQLRRAGLPADLHGWRQLQEVHRGAALPASLPPRLNQRTATAALGAHSKATLGERLRAALGPLEVTRDSLIRVRPNPGLQVRRGRETFNAEVLAACLGELALTERALRDGTVLCGVLPRALLLCENVGFYIDIRAPEGWAVVHVPGWNTSTTRLLLSALPDVPVVHFGDLDPNGVRIVAHLQAIRPDLIWAVPDFWEEQIPLRSQKKEWPPDLDLDGTPGMVGRLAGMGLWLEQEPLALDPRLTGYLESIISQGSVAEQNEADGALEE